MKSLVEVFLPNCFENDPRVLKFFGLKDYGVENIDMLNNIYFSNQEKEENFSLRIKLDKIAALNPYLHRRINLNKPGVRDFITPVDYFTSVVKPILENVADHSLNPENDIFERLSGLEKKIIVDVNISGRKLDGDYDLSNGDMINEIVIEDNGFGIRPEFVERIFEYGETSRVEKEGHGIGLSGVREFVRKNNGDIWVESELGRGTKFYFTVPSFNRLN